MIRYNPKDWFTFIFRFHKADTFRTLAPLIFLIGLYAGVIAWLEIEVWQVGEKSHIRNLSLIHSTLGLVISLLLVFRTNTAYERWWEGRKVWGSLVNSSRNLAMKLSVLATDDRAFFRAMIPNYAFAMKNHLRGVFLHKELVDCDDFVSSELVENQHVPNQIAQMMFRRLAEMEQQGKLKVEHLLLINTEMVNFTDAVGACERIKKTPIPLSYSVFLKKFIFLYVMTLPFGYVFSLGYWVMPVVAIIFYVLASLELIAEEIEDPFGKDANDLPTDEIAKTIRQSVEDLL
ncbi:MAG TPA: bestrophin family ion channel [Flavobacteriales bacterium]|nr:bestrophin family ion channel [Flavobacteriales bacterium]